MEGKLGDIFGKVLLSRTSLESIFKKSLPGFSASHPGNNHSLTFTQSHTKAFITIFIVLHEAPRKSGKGGKNVCEIVNTQE